MFAEGPLEGQHTDFHELLFLLRAPAVAGGEAPLPKGSGFVSDGEKLKKRRLQIMVANGMGPGSSYFAFLQGIPSAVIFFWNVLRLIPR